MSSKKEALGERITTMINGLKSTLPKDRKKLVVGTEEVSVSALIRTLEGFQSLWISVDDKAKVYHRAIRDRDKVVPAARELLKDLKPPLVTIYGRTSGDLLKFAIKPESERRQLTTEEQAVANERRQSTRDARGTKGRRQKAAIKGAAPRVKVDGNGQNGNSGS
jgi:hypothetical protein